MKTLESPLMRELHARGLIHQCTDGEALDRHLSEGRQVTVYAGFDPTGEGLHVGHLIALQVLNVFKAHGQTTIALLGGATAQVGDPTGKSAARPRLDPGTLTRNRDGVTADIRRAAPGAVILDNADWLGSAGLLPFLLEVGAAMPLGHLLSLETIARRLRDADATISVLEAFYPLLQGFDFLHLVRNNGPMVQVGGSDQWGNIATGLELIGKLGPRDVPAWGLTAPLLTKSDGTKMGKTLSGAVWLSPDRLDDLGLFQFWRNVSDEEAPRFARIFLPLDKLSGIDRAAGGTAEALNDLKEQLAHAATGIARGTDAADRAQAAARAAFGRGGYEDAMPRHAVGTADLRDPAAMLRKLGLAPSRNDARRLIAQGGVRIDGKVLVPDAAMDPACFRQGRVRLSLGKRRHYLLILEA